MMVYMVVAGMGLTQGFPPSFRLMATALNVIEPRQMKPEEEKWATVRSASEGKKLKLTKLQRAIRLALLAATFVTADLQPH